MANDNTELGRFDLVGLPPAPRGIPQIEVTFDIDADGIVHVAAKDKGTGKEQTIKITAPKKLSEEEIQKMVKEAEKFADEDKRKKEEVETVNLANSLVYQTEKALKDYGNKVSAAEKEKVEKELAVLKDAIKDKNIDKIKSAMESVQQASHKIAEEMYKATAAQQGAGAGAGAGAQENRDDHQSGEPEQQAGQGGPDDVIDADFKVKDDK
jgi:molecular chaperone DnaK